MLFLSSFTLFILIAFVGLKIGFLKRQLLPLNVQNWLFLPLKLMVICFFEELFFRIFPGIILLNLYGNSIWVSTFYVVITTFVFVIYHPINAKYFFEAGRKSFYNPFFLFAVTLLGFLCSGMWIVAQNWYEPFLLHCLVLIVWVNYLGGAEKLDAKKS